jgi:hypothetical protein
MEPLRFLLARAVQHRLIRQAVAQPAANFLACSDIYETIVFAGVSISKLSARASRNYFSNDCLPCAQENTQTDRCQQQQQQFRVHSIVAHTWEDWTVNGNTVDTDHYDTLSSQTIVSRN